MSAIIYMHSSLSVLLKTLKTQTPGQKVASRSESLLTKNDAPPSKEVSTRMEGWRLGVACEKNWRREKKSFKKCKQPTSMYSLQTLAYNDLLANVLMLVRVRKKSFASPKNAVCKQYTHVLFESSTHTILAHTHECGDTYHSP